MEGKPLRICKACYRTFRPQLTDDQLVDLYYEPDEVEKIQFMQAEYYGHHGVPKIHIPSQFLCEPCINDPEISIEEGIFGTVSICRNGRRINGPLERDKGRKKGKDKEEQKQDDSAK